MGAPRTCPAPPRRYPARFVCGFPAKTGNGTVFGCRFSRENRNRIVGGAVVWVGLGWGCGCGGWGLGSRWTGWVEILCATARRPPGIVLRGVSDRILYRERCLGCGVREVAVRFEAQIKWGVMLKTINGERATAAGEALQARGVGQIASGVPGWMFGARGRGW